MKKAALIKTLREKDTAVLYKELAKARLSLAKTKKDTFAGKVKDMSQITKNKRKIARILTIIYEKEMKKLEEKDEAK